jgi:hypothetical protein
VAGPIQGELPGGGQTSTIHESRCFRVSFPGSFCTDGQAMVSRVFFNGGSDEFGFGHSHGPAVVLDSLVKFFADGGGYLHTLC